jgi:hypothetical protein
LVFNHLRIFLQPVFAYIVSEGKEQMQHCQGKDDQEDRVEKFFDEAHIIYLG